MPTQRYTQAARRRDERIYRLLLAGFPRDRVAAECGISEREVTAAELRLEAEWSALGDDEVFRRRLIITCGIIASESMRAWQRSRLTSRTDNEAAGGERDCEPMGDPRHLDRVLRAISLQTKHLRLALLSDDEPTPEAPPEQEEPIPAVETVAESALDSAAAPVAESSSPDAAPTSPPVPLPARLFANPPPSAPAIPQDILADVCSRAVTSGLAPRKGR